MNEQPSVPPSHPASEPENRAPDEPEAHATPPAPPESERVHVRQIEGLDEPESTPPTPESHAASREPDRAAPQPVRPAAVPPPLPSFGAAPTAPRVAEPPQRQPEQSQRPWESGQRVQEPPPYPPRVPAPQPATPAGGVAEPPRPYEGGRYVPPPPTPPAGPSAAQRDWPGMTYTTVPAATATPVVAAPTPVTRGNRLQTALLGAIALLLLAIAVLVGINTFAPRGADPRGVQQVQVQRQLMKQQTAAEIKDTITQAQQALDNFNQQKQQAYQGAQTDADRQAILMQLSLFLQQIIAQQNNDLLLVYQDLYTQP